MDRAFLFLGGCARSGTSALHRVMQGDPHAFIGLERYVKFAQKPRQFLPALFETERFLRVEPGDTHYDSLDRFPVHRDAAERYPKAAIVGDKIPMIAPLYGQIAQHFPGARIVFIVRNILDVAASYNRRAADPEDRWPADRDYRRACEEWNEALRETLAWRGKLPIHVLEYEEFFAGRGDIAALAEFTGLDAAILARRYRAVVGQQEQRPPTRPDGLSGEQKRHISLAADFEAYRGLLGASPPAKPVRGGVAGPARGGVAGPGRGAALGVARPQPTTPAPETPAALRGRKYAEDAPLFDYGHWQPPGTRKWFRGPARPLPPEGPFIACLGAASAFGRFVETPYAALLEARLGLPCVNLGHGGARAPFYLRDQALMALLNQASLVVVEMFSARGTATAEIENQGDASAFVRWRGATGGFTFADRFFTEALKARPAAEMAALREAIRAAYVAEMRELLAALSVPTLLFYFSQRAPEAAFGLDSRESFMGLFPHFIDRGVVEALRPRATEYCEFISSTGLPQPLGVPGQAIARPPARPDGKRPLEVNRYYPSPAMHREAADVLAPRLAGLLKTGAAA